MFEDEYKMITAPAEGLYKEKGSKFIALAYPVKSIEEAKVKLEEVRKAYHDARHHCYAWRLGFDKSVFRTNDDGEPSGTAGKPILGQIQSFDLTNILIVVTRYFGGTKLGVGGLINAYKSASRDALEEAKIITKKVYDVYELKFDYPLMNEVMRILKEEGLDQTDQDFGLDCRLQFIVRKNDSNRIYDKFSNIHKVQISFVETK